jgi:transcriptional regulator with XRE-family HTH domain
MNKIIEKLRETRLQKKLPQYALAKKLGYTQGQGRVSAWELGRHSPTLQNLTDWCDALDLELVVRSKDVIQSIICPICGAALELVKRAETGVPANTYSTRCRSEVRPPHPQRCGDLCFISVPVIKIDLGKRP